MKKFIKVDNRFFEIDKDLDITKFYFIGTEGFTIYCYLLMMESGYDFAQVNIKMIKEFLNRKINGRKKSTEGLRDKRTILKYLIALKRQKYVECEELNEKTKLNDILMIKVNNTCNKEQGKGWSGISTELFSDYIHKLGHIGWSIYCLLFKNHNVNAGNPAPSNLGFAFPTEEYMGKMLNRHENTIKQYIPLLKKYKLVEVEPQKPNIYTVPNGTERIKYMPNHYIVKAKVDRFNKYYVDFN
jgi:hypothetical protein